jgi:hypothetical protein
MTMPEEPPGNVPGACKSVQAWCRRNRFSKGQLRGQLNVDPCPCNGTRLEIARRRHRSFWDILFPSTRGKRCGSRCRRGFPYLWSRKNSATLTSTPKRARWGYNLSASSTTNTRAAMSAAGNAASAPRANATSEDRGRRDNLAPAGLLRFLGCLQARRA